MHGVDGLGDAVQPTPRHNQAELSETSTLWRRRCAGWETTEIISDATGLFGTGEMSKRRVL